MNSVLSINEGEIILLSENFGFRMAEAIHQMLSETEPTKSRPFRNRRSYNREQKIEVIRWHNENGKILHRTRKHFSLNSKTILRWLECEGKIRESKTGSKRVNFTKKPRVNGNLEIEAKGLFDEYLGSRTTLDDSFGETLNVTHEEERAQESGPLVLPVVACPSDSSSLDYSSPSTPSPPPSKKRKSIRGDSIDDSILKRLINVQERQKQDEDQLFGLQVAATLRRLTNRQKADAKLKIQQVLLEVEFPNDIISTCTKEER